MWHTHQNIHTKGIYEKRSNSNAQHYLSHEHFIQNERNERKIHNLQYTDMSWLIYYSTKSPPSCIALCQGKTGARMLCPY